MRGLSPQNARTLLPLGILVAVVALMAGPAHATALNILSSPQETSGPFRHNVFHSADSAGGMSGDIKAWFDLDTSASNTFDPVSGALSASFLVYVGSSLGTGIGSVTVSGTLDVSKLDDTIETNTLLGSLDFAFAIDEGSSFGDYLEAIADDEVVAGGTVSVTRTLLFGDVLYTTSSSGRTPNTWDGTYLTLWGADGPAWLGSSKGSLSGSGGSGGFGSTADLGVDLVLQVPEPSLAWLVLPGVLGIALAGRPRRRG